LEALATRFNIVRTRMAVVGYADTIPIDSNDTETGRARNRRVDVLVMSKLALQTAPRPTSKPTTAR
jgi:chemotaxis protein MotB